ncbi:MAG: hydrolase [Gammaproteobacteria bacterium]
MSINVFKPAWWLRNAHLQTIWPVLLRQHELKSTLERERIELPDGDFIDIDWINKDKEGPMILILHGFEGSIDSHYARGILNVINDGGLRAAFMYFRGCSGEPNRLTRGYHSGETKDVAFVTKVLGERKENKQMVAIGYSLGGNILLKWMGETGRKNPLLAAVAISVPFELHKAADRIQKGFSRFYQWYLLKCVQERLVQKFQLIKPSPDNLDSITAADNIRDFDNAYTAPLHGFQDADDYYSTTSSRRYLRTIKVPTLILHAKDDPFMTEDVIPLPEELSSSVILEVTEGGGHVGFISGKYPWRPEYWLEQRIPDFLGRYIPFDKG